MSHTQTQRSRKDEVSRSHTGAHTGDDHLESNSGGGSVSGDRLDVPHHTPPAPRAPPLAHAPTHVPSPLRRLSRRVTCPPTPLLSARPPMSEWPCGHDPLRFSLGSDDLSPPARQPPRRPPLSPRLTSLSSPPCSRRARASRPPPPLGGARAGAPRDARLCSAAHAMRVVCKPAAVHESPRAVSLLQRGSTPRGDLSYNYTRRRRCPRRPLSLTTARARAPHPPHPPPHTPPLADYAMIAQMS